MPHGPAHAVLVAAAVMTHGASTFGAGGNTMSCGWPDSARVMSGSGPLGPITHGVWQSWQPDVVTMYLPRAIFSAVVSAFSSALEGCARAGSETAIVDATAVAST